MSAPSKPTSVDYEAMYGRNWRDYVQEDAHEGVLPAEHFLTWREKIGVAATAVADTARKVFTLTVGNLGGSSANNTASNSPSGSGSPTRASSGENNDLTMGGSSDDAQGLGQPVGPSRFGILYNAVSAAASAVGSAVVSGGGKGKRAREEVQEDYDKDLDSDEDAEDMCAEGRGKIRRVGNEYNSSYRL